MANIITYLKAKPWRNAGIALVIIIVLFMIFGRGGGEELQTVPVTRGAVRQVVDVTGKTRGSEAVDLAFERSGRVARVRVSVGDTVTVGQTLVELEASDLYAQLTQAEANVLSAQAKLDELVRGSRPEDIAISRTDVTKAEQDLEQEYNSVRNTLQETYADSDDAIRKQIDDLFLNDDQANPQLSFLTSNTQNQNNAQNLRLQATKALNDWKSEITSLGPTGAHPGLSAAIDHALAHVNLFRSLLNELNEATSGATSISASTISTYKGYINTARTSVNGAGTALTAQAQSFQSSILALQRAKNQLDLKLAGSDPEQITAQRAQVKQAEANVMNTEAQIAKTVIRSPISGIVTKQEAKAGQIAGAGTVVASVISGAKLEIEANIPEVDIGRIAIGKPVVITLDALAGEVFAGFVAAIDPAETVIEGVSTYKTTVTLETEDSRVRSGMTANMEILVDEHQGALSVPQRAVVTKNGKRYVMIVVDKTPEEREVETGLRGQNGEVEILKGLNEGDLILRSPQ